MDAEHLDLADDSFELVFGARPSSSSPWATTPPQGGRTTEALTGVMGPSPIRSGSQLEP